MYCTRGYYAEKNNINFNDNLYINVWFFYFTYINNNINNTNNNTIKNRG